MRESERERVSLLLFFFYVTVDAWNDVRFFVSVNWAILVSASEKAGFCANDAIT